MKKYVILIILSALILAQKPSPDLPVCNLTTAKQAIPPRIFAEQTIDGIGQPIILTRFLHNKFGIFGSEFTRCYFYSLDPNFIYHSVSIGITSWLYFIYFSTTRKLIFPGFVFLIIPALPFFGIPLIIVSYAHKIFAIIGIIFWIFKKK